ncbi:MotA/TolQ/ExbB proton channel family protein [bacterium]|nr:MotA/TolQ/ExbB proton channel family protein [bacterium]
MADFWQSFMPGYSGWFFMWLLGLSGAVMVAVAVERAVYVFLKSNINAPQFMLQVFKYLDAQEIQKAVQFCRSLGDKALPQVIELGLVKMSKVQKVNPQSVQNVMDEGTLEVIPKLQARTSYLAMFANISTLLGLMGTIYGLIISFRSISAPGIDAAEKSRLLAHGIAVAMNTTLLGLAIAIPAVMIYTVIQNKTNQIIDEIDEHAAKLVNRISE